MSIYSISRHQHHRTVRGDESESMKSKCPDALATLDSASQVAIRGDGARGEENNASCTRSHCNVVARACPLSVTIFVDDELMPLQGNFNSASAANNGVLD